MNLLQVTAVSCLIMFVLSGCATPAGEQIRLPGDLPGWKLGHKQRDRLNHSVFSELILETEYISNWSKKVSLEFYDKNQMDPEAFMLRLKSKMARFCKNIQSRVLDKQADSIMYEWRIKDCKRYPDQHILARIIRGKEGLHRVAYIEKTRDISPDNYRQWQKKLLGAYLEAGGP